MLTATYAQVVISAEQNKARAILSKLQQYIRQVFDEMQSIDRSAVEAAYSRLTQFERFCRGRKLELCLIPALRNATHEADCLLQELEMLTAAGLKLLNAIGGQLYQVVSGSDAAAQSIIEHMRNYCDAVHARLIREETELFPLARRVLSTEEWFAIASKFLSDEATEPRREFRPRTSISRPAPRAATPLPA